MLNEIIKMKTKLKRVIARVIIKSRKSKIKIERLNKHYINLN